MTSMNNTPRGLPMPDKQYNGSSTDTFEINKGGITSHVIPTVDKEARARWNVTNWHDSPLMIVKSADPNVNEGTSLKKMLNEIEVLLANGYTLKTTIECNGEIFAFLINESELRSGMGSRTTPTTTTIEEHESEEWYN